jgi:hypothetical protein
MLIGVYLRSSAAINDFFTASQGAVASPQQGSFATDTN